MEQTQPKLSKYAAKQQRLATDPTFGNEYIFDQISAAIKEKDAKREAEEEAAKKKEAKAKELQQVRLDKILKMQLEVRQMERHIESLRAHIEKLQRAIERQKELLNAEEA